MKTAGSARKKVELRERLLKYASEHAENDRIPTVSELREALGVTNYLLLNCMNELIREGLLYRKSRKEGTFLAWHQKKYVIGLFEDCGGSGFVDIPAWMSGFYRAFTRTDDFLLRIFAQDRVNGGKEFLDLDVGVLKLSLLGYGNDVLKLSNLFVGIERDRFKRFFNVVFDIQFSDVLFGKRAEFCRLILENFKTALQALTDRCRATCDHTLHDDEQEDQAHILFAVPECLVIGL